MSRAQYQSDRYTFAFGVDHTPMGPFLQLWDKDLPIDEYDTPHIDIDAMYGIRIADPSVLNNQALDAAVQKIAAGFRFPTHVNMSARHVVSVLKALDFPWQEHGDIERKIYELWD